MSKVYKWDEITLGEKKIIKLKSSQIIKSNKDKTTKNKEDSQLDSKVSEDIQAIIEEAKVKAEEMIEAAKLECDEIVSRTKIEQQSIISEAYTESNQILENARAEGYKQGIAEGKEVGLNLVDSLIEEAKQIKQITLADKKTVAKALEKQIIGLVISCVKKIISHELEMDHKLLLNLVESGIEKCTYTDSLIVRVSLNDYEMVDSSKNKIYMMTEGIDNIEVKKDPALEDGSIIIETISGTVDASLQTQITQIEQMFYDILKGE